MSGIRGLSGWLGVVLECPDPSQLADFYRDLLGWEIADRSETWVTMGMPGAPANLAFQRSDDFQPPVWPPSPGKQQMLMHLDVGVVDLPGAVDDALALGARLAAHQPQEDVRVLVDPVGHLFCLYVDPDPPQRPE